MVIATVAVVAPRGKRRDIERALRSVVGPTEVASGCLGCFLYRDTARDHRFLLVTTWQDRSRLDAYLRATVFRTILGVMEQAAEPPEFEVRTASEPLGMEIVEAAWAAEEETP